MSERNLPIAPPGPGQSSAPRRTPGRALAAVAALAALAYLLPLAATLFIGQEALRERAQQALSAALDRPVEVSGGARLTLSPWFGLRTGPVRVANPPGFGDEPFLVMQSASISLDLLALARKSVVVDSVSLTRPSVNLARDASGRGNWLPPGTGREPGQGGGQWTMSSLPTGLTLEDASLSFKDAASGAVLEVRSLDLSTTPSRPFDFTLSCTVEASPWGLAGEVRAQGKGSYGDDGAHVFVSRSTVSGWFELPAWTGAPGKRASFSTRLSVHGEGGAFEATGIVVDGLGARVTGQVTAAGLYEPVPYVHVDLAAVAEGGGEWTALLDPASRGGEAIAAPRRSPDPELRRQPGPGTVQARLALDSVPGGWIVHTASLSDGEGSLDFTGSDAEGELRFTVDAKGMDLGRWLPARLPQPAAALAAAVGRAARTDGRQAVFGRVSVRDSRLGPLDIVDAQATAQARGDELRLYPVTARMGRSMVTADLRTALSGDLRSFSGRATVQALPGQGAPGGEPASMLDLSLSGAAGPEGLTGGLKLSAAAHSKDWSPPWLSEEAARVWAILGGGALSCSFSLPASGAALSLWDVDARTPHSRITGKASLTPGRASLDLQADQIDMERLTLVGSAWDKGVGGYAPIPLDARVAVGRLAAWGLSVEDFSATLEASRRELRLTAASGAALGGRVQGSLDLQEDGAGARSLSGTVTATGVQSAQVSALGPNLPRLTGALDAKISAESSFDAATPPWQSLTGQAELRLGRGGVSFTHAQEGARPWPVDKAQANLKFAVRKAPHGQNGKPREAALADVSGSIRVETPGMVRSSRLELKGQAGLDGSGRPLWLRQPRAEGAHVLEAPFAARGAPALAAWSGRLDADFEAGGFSMGPLELNVAGVPGRASLSGQPGKDSLELSGFVDLPEFNPRAAASRLGYAIPAEADQNSWRRARFSADIAGGAKEIRLTKIQATLDDAAITGQATISGRSTRLDLAVTTLDLDRLLPEPGHSGAGRRPESPLPLARLRELALEAKVRLGWLKKDRLIFTNAQADFSASGGRFQFRQSAPDFYGGQYFMDIKGDARGEELRASMDLKLSGFSPGPLLLDLAGSGSVSGGRADFSVKVDTRGATDRALRRRASGNAGFEVRGGSLGVKDMPQRQPQAPAGLTGERDTPPVAPAPAQAQGLPFSRLGASFTIRDGMAVTRDFALESAALTARGDGWVSLDDEKIDLSLSAKVPDVGDVPVRITGPLYDPRMDIDKSKVLSDTIINIFKGVVNIPGSILMQLRQVF